MALWAALQLQPPAVPEPANLQDFNATEQKAWAADPDCDSKTLQETLPLSKQHEEAKRCAKDAEQRREEKQSAFEALRTADATQEAADMARRQDIVGAWTFGVILAAFGASLWAAYAASQAANAADKTLDHARLSSERELRAYVYPQSVHVRRKADGDWIIRFQFKNFGSTPAHRVDAAWGANVVDCAGDEPTDWPDTTDGSLFGSLAPTDVVWMEIEVSGTTTLRELNDGKKAICLEGKINYDTVFSEDQLTGFNHTWFRYYVGGDEQITPNELRAQDGAEMSAASSGNDAN